MRHREMNSFESIEDIVKFFGDPNRLGRSSTWVGKNYSLSQLIIDLQNIEKRGRNSDGRVSD